MEIEQRNLRKRGPLQRGLSLIELLITIGIIAVLAALLIPTVGKMTASAKQTKCLSNLRQTGNILASYMADNNGSLPRNAQVGEQNDVLEFWRYLIPAYTDKQLRCPCGRAPHLEIDIYRYNYALSRPMAHRFPTLLHSSPKSRTFLLAESYSYYFYDWQHFEVTMLALPANERFPAFPPQQHSGGLHVLFSDFHAELVVPPGDQFRSIGDGYNQPGEAGGEPYFVTPL